ncbi:D-alanyl-D-alanine carboxypeptidase [Tistrella bauzanensis]|uniref:D-alanyl-D-alanine carboxypeptidase n=1 Tax=Tistrella TaxID=171436 RepID=UPI0031F6E814
MDIGRYSRMRIARPDGCTRSTSTRATAAAGEPASAGRPARVSLARLPLIRLALVLLVAVMAATGFARDAAAGYAALVVEADTGRVLYSKNGDVRNYPASLTKMMTLYMTFEAIKARKLSMDTALPVSARAAGMAPTKLGLRAGQTIKVKDAVYGLITKSANDAAVVLAEAISGSEIAFARAMTARARKLGMEKTTFQNANGLPNRHQLSTARDMATLAVRLMNDFPREYALFSTKSYNYKGQELRNHNRLLSSYTGTDGIKTGYTRASGFNIVVSAVRDDRRLIGVIFGGSTSRERDKAVAALLDKSFTRLASETPAERQRAIASARARGELQIARLERDLDDIGGSGIQVASITDAQVAAAERDMTGAAAIAAVDEDDAELAETTQVAAAAPTPAPATQLAAVAAGTANARAADIRNGPAPQPVAQGDTQYAAIAPKPRVFDAQGRWGIQFGAFGRVDAAQGLVGRAQDLLPAELRSGAETAVEPHSIGGRYIYRARMMGFEGERPARQACALLDKRGIACILVPPISALSAAG